MKESNVSGIYTEMITNLQSSIDSFQQWMEQSNQPKGQKPRSIDDIIIDIEKLSRKINKVLKNNYKKEDEINLEFYPQSKPKKIRKKDAREVMIHIDNAF
ncbi:MAG: hypothetical protein HYZ42_05950, partial [Bacteroidetes bacterium]|nr:hypothetical protein [Bacteroidota bacterium]